VLREQVVLQQAARDGARVAATGYGSAVTDSTVSDAVLASAADLPALKDTPGYDDFVPRRAIGAGAAQVCPRADHPDFAPDMDLTGSYTAYFFSLDQSLSTSSNAILEYRSTRCP
jgi:hypothetical protein